MSRIIHVVPDSLEKAHHRFLGSGKDTMGRTEYFEARGCEVHTIVAEDRSDEAVSRELEALKLGGFDAAVFELPLYPRALEVLRRRAPKIRRLVRAINAECLQRLHLWSAHRRYPYSHEEPGQLRADLRDAWHRLRLDYACARAADVLLSISDWETDRYWRRLAGRRAVTVPYFTPRLFEQEGPDAVKEPLCLCMLSTSNTIKPFTLDALQNFTRLARGFRWGHKKSPWRFAVTGNLAVRTMWPEVLSATLRLPKGIEHLGFVPDPIALSARARAIAVLSDYGFGFKTKILDAITTQTWVLLPRALYERLPAEVRPFCIVVALDSTDSFAEALDRATQPYPPGSPNTALRARAFEAMDRALGRT